MPKAQNLLRTEQLTISTTPQILSFLGRLVRTGLYGKNHAEAAERLIAKSLEALIADDLFDKISPAADAGEAEGRHQHKS